jgi:phosphoribosylaminoimidazolecarboxamide formyltransferase/IMP cyclohydrolase
MDNHQKTALISVYNKDGIVDFAKELVGLGWKIISSGGTAKHLTEAGVVNTDVADITSFPPILSHRVVTLHPKIHGGLLALDTPEHQAELEKYGIPWIDMVCSDLYPLQDEINKPGSTKESVIAQTDMGGVALIRSSAKGRRITICDPSDRTKVIEWLKNGEQDKEKFLDYLAAKAEATVTCYVSLSATYHSGGLYKSIFGKKISELAYGENAYQKPAFLYEGVSDSLAISNWKQVEGNPLSYNNLCDVDRMIQTVTHIGAGFEKNTNKIPKIALGVKHGNACGAGVAETGEEAIEKMLQGDLRAIFGGSVMLNFAVDEKLAEVLINKFMPEGGRRLLDIVAAPSFAPEAIEILARKKGKCRILVNKNIENGGVASLDSTSRFRYVRGGFLTQPNYTFVPEVADTDVILGWAVGCTSNSNTITITKEGRLVGNGVGQQDRVGAAKLAIFRADDAAKFADAAKEKADLEGATAYSDSFFPFPDAPQTLIDRGIKTIFSTSGSVNDDKIKELCDSKGVKLIMIPDSEGRGFYQH